MLGGDLIVAIEGEPEEEFAGPFSCYEQSKAGRHGEGNHLPRQTKNGGPGEFGRDTAGHVKSGWFELVEVPAFTWDGTGGSLVPGALLPVGGSHLPLHRLHRRTDRAIGLQTRHSDSRRHFERRCVAHAIGVIIVGAGLLMMARAAGAQITTQSDSLIEVCFRSSLRSRIHRSPPSRQHDGRQARG